MQLVATHGGDTHLHAELLLRLGQAQRHAGSPAERETLLAAAAEARNLGDTELIVAAGLSNGRGWASVPGAVDPERIAVLEHALDAVGPGDTRARV